MKVIFTGVTGILAKSLNRTLAPLLVLLVLTLSFPLPVQADSSIRRASVNSDGVQGNWDSFHMSLSADGRYLAFASSATNLVPDDTNLSDDVFVRDLTENTTIRVSVDSGNNQANSYSNNPGISGNGRYVAFKSYANNLVDGDTNGVTDIFVRDLVDNTTTRVSIASDGSQANGDSEFPTVSNDGRYVCFHSYAGNLSPDDNNSYRDVFVRDLVDNTTTLASVNSSGHVGYWGGNTPRISGNGRYVVFQSESYNLVDDDTNGAWDIFVRDLVDNTTARASIAFDGSQANNYCMNADISSDGRHVVFFSIADNLVPNDTNGSGIQDGFVRDLVDNTTTRVNIAWDGGQSTGGGCNDPRISDDGSRVVFYSQANNLIPGDSGGYDVYVRDLALGAISKVSTTYNGGQADGENLGACISGDGSRIAFGSEATNLVPDDTNLSDDVFVVDYVAPPPPVPLIRVTRPDEGFSYWYIGSSENITWNSVLVSGNVNILVSRDGGSTYTPIISDTPNDGIQAWTVTGPATTQARIGVESADNQTIYDICDADFDIRDPGITVTSPVGGESWAEGSSQTITWTSGGVTGNVDILISRDGGATGYDYLIADTPNDGSQAWTVTGPATTQARIAVQSHDDQYINDASDGDFTITACPRPGAPTLSSPLQGATVSGTSTTFTWAAGTGSPSNYQLQVYSNAAFSGGTSYFNNTVGNNTSRWVGTLPNNGTTVYWHVRAYNACGWGDWSAYRSFTSGACSKPGAPTLSSPASAACVSGTSGTFSWAAGTGGPTKYMLQVSANPAFTGANIYYNQVNATSQLVTVLPNNGSVLYWRVLPGNAACGWGTAWSARRSFYNGKPGMPTLSTPAAGAHVANTSVTFTWAAGTGTPANYFLQVSTSPTWAGPNKYYAMVSGTSKVVSGFPNDGTVYYWRVTAGNTCGWSLWSARRALVNGP